ncbi:MAG: hypothetical protein IPO17_18350 [Flavobacteriales bacterium]|nr:hypothetical protein [Flavobacteriales bacterium]
MDTRQTVRAMALDMPGTAEKGQFGRPSFSVKKKTGLELVDRGTTRGTETDTRTTSHLL